MAAHNEEHLEPSAATNQVEVGDDIWMAAAVG
jgi:hypothetical protein